MSLRSTFPQATADGNWQKTRLLLRNAAGGRKRTDARLEYRTMPERLTVSKVDASQIPKGKETKKIARRKKQRKVVLLVIVSSDHSLCGSLQREQPAWMMNVQ